MTHHESCPAYWSGRDEQRYRNEGCGPCTCKQTDAERIAKLKAENLKMFTALRVVRSQSQHWDLGFTQAQLRLQLQLCTAEVNEAIDTLPLVAHAARVREEELAVIEAAERISRMMRESGTRNCFAENELTDALARLEQVRGEEQ